MKKGRIFLLPNLLGSEKWEHVIPLEVAEIAKKTRFFAVENIKTARRYLRKLDPDFPIDEATFFVLDKKTSPQELPKILLPVKNGNDVAIISEAGCPGIADPGADLVALAHQHYIFVSPLTGPSSILLALIGSGFNGQSFCFNGYIPKNQKERINTFKRYEMLAQKTGQTQIFMETPYRNNHLFEDLLNHCLDKTFLCVACDLTLPTERVQTMSVSDWRKNAFSLDKRPTMFLIGVPFGQ